MNIFIKNILQLKLFDISLQCETRKRNRNYAKRVDYIKWHL